ncbi:MAG: hypothetical protein PVH82_07300, partial [Desulfobacteraceae bacterium]
RNIKLQGLFFAGIIWLGLVGTTYGISLEQLKWRLELALENLLISEATEAHVSSELVRLRKSGKASRETLVVYENYLRRLQEMVQENRRIVRDMQGAYTKLAQRRQTTTSSKQSEKEETLDPKIPEEQISDEKTTLESELNDSLGEFDEKMLKEWDKILAKSSQRMRDLAEEVAEADQESKQEGEWDKRSSRDIAPDPEKGSEDVRDQEKETHESSKAGTEDKEDRGFDSKGDGKDKSIAKREPDRSKDYDEDIVARQLREAAERETDPELKEKLWKEYEDYKRDVAREGN